MNKNSGKTGTYVFDRKTGKIVKISDEIPALKKSAGHVCGGDCGCCAHNDN